MIRAALVGISGYGRWHLLMALEQAALGRLRIVGATVINRAEHPGVCARLARHGVPVFDTYEDMMTALAGSVDLVLVPTGMHWHAPMTMAALRAGAHVLVEKPLAPTLAEVDAIIAAQAVAGRIVAVGFQDLYVPATHDIKRRVLRGEIGGLRRIVVRGQWPRGAAYYRRNPWAGRLRVDGAWVLDSPAANAFAHFLVLSLFWSGSSPEAVATVATVEAELYRASAIESFDTCCLRVRTPEGIEILFYGTHAGAEEHPPEVTLWGDHGTIGWHYERNYTIAPRGAPATEFPVPDQLETRLSVLDAMLDRIEGKPGFIVEPSLAREHTRLLNALHEFFPIRAIPESALERTRGAAGEGVRIRDVDTTIATAAREGRLFSELPVPWGVPCAGTRTLAGYDSFGGCFVRADSLRPPDPRRAPERCARD